MPTSIKVFLFFVVAILDRNIASNKPGPIRRHAFFCQSAIVLVQSYKTTVSQHRLLNRIHIKYEKKWHK